MLPVNFAVAGKAIIFRTAPDTLLAVYADGQVSFEADHLDEALGAGWSVLVHGRAHKVTDERGVNRLEDRTHLQPWAGGARDVYVRIAPNRISGRCIEPGRASPLAAGHASPVASRPSALSQSPQAASIDGITLSEGEDQEQRAHPRSARQDPRQLPARHGYLGWAGP